MAAIDGPSSAEPLLTTSGLTKSFHSLVALKNHDIAVRPGEIVGVIGPNGSGKSTFFNVVMASCAPIAARSGSTGQPIQRLSASAIVRLGHRPHVPGHPPVPATHSARECARRSPAPAPMGIADAVLGIAAAARRSRRSRRSPTSCSTWWGSPPCRKAGGRTPLRRPAAAGAGPRARHRPRLLMLDEPAAGMDAAETRDLLRLIDMIRQPIRPGGHRRRARHGPHHEPLRADPGAGAR